MYGKRFFGVRGIGLSKELLMVDIVYWCHWRCNVFLLREKTRLASRSIDSGSSSSKSTGTSRASSIRLSIRMKVGSGRWTRIGRRKLEVDRVWKKPM